MTKKHFESIANILNAYGKFYDSYDVERKNMFDNLVWDISEYLVEQNELFDHDKFSAVCYKK